MAGSLETQGEFKPTYKRRHLNIEEGHRLRELLNEPKERYENLSIKGRQKDGGSTESNEVVDQEERGEVKNNIKEVKRVTHYLRFAYMNTMD